MPDDAPENKYKSLREAGPYMGLGFQIAATMALMLWLGIEVDEYLDTYPIFLIIFLFFGGFAGIYNFIKSVLELK